MYVCIYIYISTEVANCLVFAHSFGFQTKILNILFIRGSDKMAILSDKMMTTTAVTMKLLKGKVTLLNLSNII